MILRIRVWLEKPPLLQEQIQVGTKIFTIGISKTARYRQSDKWTSHFRLLTIGFCVIFFGKLLL